MFQKTRDRKSIFFCFSILLMTGMVLLAGCGKQNTGKKNAAKQAAAHYRILVCQGTPTETFDPQALEKGFLDSLSSTLGEENLEVETFRITDPDDSRIKITQLLEQTAEDEPGFSLIFTEDAASLSAAAMSTSQVPIVSAGCLSIPDTLGSKYIDEDKQLTGRNVTGVSSQPPVDAQLSLLIEVTKNLENVGILYTPEDSDAIKQNRILESYLDEAHIPWKEYILPSKAYRKYLADEGDTENMNPLEAGTYGDPQIPLVSGSWKGPKGKKTEKNTDPRTFKTRLPRKASQKKNPQLCLPGVLRTVPSHGKPDQPAGRGNRKNSHKKRRHHLWRGSGIRCILPRHAVREPIQLRYGGSIHCGADSEGRGEPGTDPCHPPARLCICQTVQQGICKEIQTGFAKDIF